MNLRTEITITVKTFVGHDIHASSPPSHARKPNTVTQSTMTRVQELHQRLSAPFRAKQTVEHMLTTAAPVLAKQVCLKLLN